MKFSEFPEELQAERSRRLALSVSDRLQEDCDRMNQQPGELTGYNCPICMNRGYTYVVRGDDMVQRQCSCLEVRRSMRRIQKSGLATLLEAS